MGFGLRGLIAATRGEQARTEFAQTLSRESLSLWARLWVATMLVSFAYFWLKVMVPLLNEGTWDEALWTLDRHLHLGVAPVPMAVSGLGAGALLRALDVGYGLWLPSVVFGIAFFAADADLGRRRRFVHACLLVWSLGALLYLALPALGPALAFPSNWTALATEMPIAAHTQHNLWTNYEAIRTSRGGPLPSFDPTRGVAAFPSLHVAFHALFAIRAARSDRTLGLALAALTAFTFIGSIRTGWHYAIDGYAGAALAAGAWWLAGRLERVRSADSSSLQT